MFNTIPMAYSFYIVSSDIQSEEEVIAEAF